MMISAAIIANSGTAKYGINSECVVSIDAVKYESYCFIIFEFLIQLILLHDGIVEGFGLIGNYVMALNRTIVINLHC